MNSILKIQTSLNLALIYEYYSNKRSGREQTNIISPN